MIYNKEIIAARIKHERTKYLKVSQEQFADLMQCSRPTVYKWEKPNGENHIPEIEQLLKMCELFNCEMAYLFGEIDTKKRSNTDIQKLIGLTESAIEQLRQYKYSTDIKRKIYNKNRLDQLKGIDDLMKDKNDVTTITDYWEAMNINRPELIDQDYMILDFLSFALTENEALTKTIKAICKHNILLYRFYAMPEREKNICVKAYKEATKSTGIDSTAYEERLKEKYDQFVEKLCKENRIANSVKIDNDPFADYSIKNKDKLYYKLLELHYENKLKDFKEEFDRIEKLYIEDRKNDFYIMHNVLSDDLKDMQQFFNTKELLELLKAYSEKSQAYIKESLNK